jgi:hypothetical protein
MKPLFFSSSSSTTVIFQQTQPKDPWAEASTGSRILIEDSIKENISGFKDPGVPRGLGGFTGTKIINENPEVRLPLLIMFGLGDPK